MRSRARRLAATACLLLATGVLLLPNAAEARAGHADAGEAERVHASGVRASARRNGIDVLKVDGLIDPATASLVEDTVRDANENESTMLVLQIDSGGSVDVDIEPLIRAVRRSRVPVVAWVGPSGADARGAAAMLVEAAPIASVSSGSSIGPASPLALDHPDDPAPSEARRRLARLARANDRSARGARQLTHRKLSADEARRLGAVDTVRPTVGELIVSLDGRTVATADGARELSTARVIGEGLDRRRQPNQEVRFIRLDLDGQLLHTLTSPSVAYLLFVAGFALIVFEFYTCGVGLAGLVGAISVIGGLVGFSHLPVNWWAAALLMLAIFGFTVDVQAGSLAVWTIIGSISLVVGSVFLYGGSSRLDPAWWVLAVVIGGTALFMLGAMTAVIRSRFSTPTVGREGMIGGMGQAEVDVDPDGVVVIDGSRWRARTNRVTPIKAGEPVRVVAVEGLVLEVEPEGGGAMDYRERAKQRGQRRKQGRQGAAGEASEASPSLAEERPPGPRVSRGPGSDDQG